MQAPGAPEKVKTAGPFTLTTNVQPLVPTVKVFAPGVVGVPAPFKVTVCIPVAENIPDFEKVIPPAVVVILYEPMVVTFTWTVTVLVAPRAVDTA